MAAHTHPEGWSGRLCVIVTSRNKNSSVPCYSTNFLYSTERNSLCWQFFTSSCEREELLSSSSPLVGGEGRISPSLMLPVSPPLNLRATQFCSGLVFLWGVNQEEKGRKRSHGTARKKDQKISNKSSCIIIAVICAGVTLRVQFRS